MVRPHDHSAGKIWSAAKPAVSPHAPAIPIPTHIIRPVALAAATTALALATGCSPKAADTQTPAQLAAARLELGRHLVEDVGMCADCHSPRLPTGDFDKARWLQGSPLAFASTVPMPWAPLAPAIAGLPGYTDDQALAFLTGRGPKANGSPALPPMPAYRFNDGEARAVITYLRSLPAPTGG